ncbi:MAG: TRAP transporter large permease subunit, partial [Eubacteriales bacterium]|nr:TRAP transporter large permease subunit [Eubacteriales bacterium]
MSLVLFFGVFVILLVIGSPIYISMIVSSIAYIITNPTIDFVIMIQKLASSVNSFPLLAVPLFIFAGQLMNLGGVTSRIFQFAQKLVGHFRGGLGHVNVVASIIFSGMSGSALADVGGLGQIEIAAMREAKYGDDFALGVTAASGTIGPIIPPSIPFVIYGAFASVSVGALFMGGLLPGVLMGGCLMVMVAVISKKRNYSKGKRASLKEIWQAFKKGFLALLTPIIIIGGIWSGVFTPTEAALVSIIYALIIPVFFYKDVTDKVIPKKRVETFKISTPSLAILVGA